MKPFFLFAAFLFLACIPTATAVTDYLEIYDYTSISLYSDADSSGIIMEGWDTLATLKTVVLQTGCGASRVRIFNKTDGCALLATASVVNGNATFDLPLAAGYDYSIEADNSGSSYQKSYFMPHDPIESGRINAGLFTTAAIAGSGGTCSLTSNNFFNIMALEITNDSAAPPLATYLSGYSLYPNGTVAVNASIAAYYESNSTLINFDLSDANGFFDFEVVNASITLASTITSVYEYYGSVVTNVAGNITQNVTMDLIRKVHGFVSYDNGTFYDGFISVRILNASGDVVNGVTSITDGDYTISTNELGYLWVEANSTTYGYDLYAEDVVGTGIDTEVNLTLRGERNIQGRVFYNNGTASSVATVWLYNSVYNSESQSQNVTPTGFFSFNTTWQHVQLQAGEVGGYFAIENYNLTTNLSTSLTYQMESLYGIVSLPTGYPAAGMDISILSSDFAWSYGNNVTDANGAFNFTTVSSGTYGFCVLVGGSCQYFTASYLDNPVNFTINATNATASGYVKYANGSAIPNVTISIDNTGLQNNTFCFIGEPCNFTALYSTSTTSDLAGFYETTLPYYGKWNFWVTDPFFQNPNGTFGFAYSYPSTNVSAGIMNNFTMPSMVNVTIMVKDSATNLPIEDIWVYVWQYPTTLQTFGSTYANGTMDFHAHQSTYYSINITASLTGANSLYYPSSTLFWTNETRYIEFFLTPYVAPQPSATPSIADAEFTSVTDGWILAFLISLVLALFMCRYSPLFGALSFVFALFIFTGMRWLPLYVPIVTAIFMAGLYAVIPKEQ